VLANPNKRDVYVGHEFFDDCAKFCENWDQSSFDPDYETLSIEFFAPMVQEVFAREPYDPTVMSAGPKPLFDNEVAESRAL
jgi:predicted HD phosphohydrolase